MHRKLSSEPMGHEALDGHVQKECHAETETLDDVSFCKVCQPDRRVFKVDHADVHYVGPVIVGDLEHFTFDHCRSLYTMVSHSIYKCKLFLRIATSRFSSFLRLRVFLFETFQKVGLFSAKLTPSRR